jgi:NodT family efflux transporter outer membrane factor (OMF) lipoprotein
MKEDMKKYIAIICITALLSGCKVGPDYKKPDVNLPATWQADTQKQTDAIQQDWWKHFHDPVLDQLIEKAVAGNFDFKIAAARIAEARAASSSAWADLTPMVNAKATAVRQANEIGFPGNAGSFPFDIKKPFDIYQPGFDASWELDLFGGKRRGLESANAELEAAEASRDDARVSILAEVARTYVNIRAYQTQLAIANETIKSNEETLKLSKQRFNAGEVPKLDVARANAQLTQSQSQLPYYQSMLAEAEYSMDVLLGSQPGSTHTIVAEVKPVPVGDKALVLAAPASVIANRPDIRMAERKLASATAQQGVATAQLFPDISLSGFLGFFSTNTSGLFTAANKAWNIGGSITLPILNYSKIKANINAADARQEEAFETYQKSIVVALTDVEKSVTSYDKEEEHRELLGKTAQENAHAVKITRERYKAGLSSFLEVLDAERTLYTSQSQAADADAKASQDMVAVYKSLGGGWKDAQPTENPASKP